MSFKEFETKPIQDQENSPQLEYKSSRRHPEMLEIVVSTYVPTGQLFDKDIHVRTPTHLTCVHLSSTKTNCDLLSQLQQGNTPPHFEHCMRYFFTENVTYFGIISNPKIFNFHCTEVKVLTASRKLLKRSYF